MYTSTTPTVASSALLTLPPSRSCMESHPLSLTRGRDLGHSFLCWIAQVRCHLLEDHVSGARSFIWVFFLDDTILSACDAVLLCWAPIHAIYTTRHERQLHKIPGVRDHNTPTSQHITNNTARSQHLARVPSHHSSPRFLGSPLCIFFTVTDSFAVGYGHGLREEFCFMVNG